MLADLEDYRANLGTRATPAAFAKRMAATQARTGKAEADILALRNTAAHRQAMDMLNMIERNPPGADPGASKALHAVTRLLLVGIMQTLDGTRDANEIRP
ncbi:MULTISPECIES: hypothetical protein [Actinomycetes]|uniref:hypothetical protein n=1 Tax=Actinomycetes TaxID=1760 RepID=UPI001319DA48|nr:MULTISPECIES: hypothetical protein [Actinomycetes]